MYHWNYHGRTIIQSSLEILTLVVLPSLGEGVGITSQSASGMVIIVLFMHNIIFPLHLEVETRLCQNNIVGFTWNGWPLLGVYNIQCDQSLD